MASSLPSAGIAHPQSMLADLDDLSEPLHRIDQAHKLIAELDSPAAIHGEPFTAPLPGSTAALAKESPTSAPAAEVSPPVVKTATSAASTGTRETDDLRSKFVAEAEPSWSPEQMLHAHAEDLIAFLQSWSDDLDQRSAKLHADIATQERRERSFRLWMQQRRAEMELEQAQQQKKLSSQQASARRAFFQATEGEWSL